jgi:hypothetical protein
MNFFCKRFRFMSTLIAGVAFGILGSASAWAASVTVSAGSVTVAPGSSMDSFDVDLTNLGSSALTIGGFSFELSVANADISFTGVNTSTAASYIFSGNSLFGPNLSGPTSGQTISASDAVLTPSTGTTINAGGTVGLGHVLFNVSAGAAAGTFAVDLTPFPNTTLSDALGNNVTINTLSPGQITITGPTSVPEPSSFFILLLLLTATPLLSRLRSDAHFR